MVSSSFREFSSVFPSHLEPSRVISSLLELPPVFSRFPQMLLISCSIEFPLVLSNSFELAKFWNAKLAPEHTFAVFTSILVPPKDACVVFWSAPVTPEYTCALFSDVKKGSWARLFSVPVRPSASQACLCSVSKRPSGSLARLCSEVKRSTCGPSVSSLVQ